MFKMKKPCNVVFCGLMLSSFSLLAVEPESFEISDQELACVLNASSPSCSNGVTLTQPNKPSGDVSDHSEWYRLENLRNYRYQVQGRYSFGAQTYARDFGNRGKTVGFGAQFESSSMSLTLHNPGVSWMKDIDEETQLNVRVSDGGEHGDKGQLIIGIGRHW